MGDVYDRVRCGVTGTPGTGTITLGAAERSATEGDFLTFAEAAVPDGAIVSYVITDGNKWAKGRRGVYSASGNTLTRDAAEINWSGAAQAAGKLNCTSAAKVMIVALGADVGGLTLLQSGLINSAIAALDITGLDASHDEWELRLFNFLSAASSDSLVLRLSTDNGATFLSGANDYAYVSTEGTTASSVNLTNSLVVHPQAAGLASDAATPGYSGIIKFIRPAVTARMVHVQSHGAAMVNSSSHRLATMAGALRAAGDVDAFRLAFSANNIEPGAMYKLYGVKK